MIKLYTIIAGSRSIINYKQLEWCIKLVPWEVGPIISGMARGVDSLAIQYANTNDITLIQCPAEWDKYGKSAGYRRNIEMAKKADALIALWDGQSKGTKHMIDIAIDHELFIYVKKV